MGRVFPTSANGLWGICTFAWNKKWHGIPVFAVGDITAKAARDMGFAEVASAGGNVNDLAKLVAARLSRRRGCFISPARNAPAILPERCGQKTSRSIWSWFTAFSRRNCFHSPPREALAGEIDGVLHFSRASAEAFSEAARNSKLLDAALTKPVHFCLSENVAAPLREAGAATFCVAARPDEAALLELCV